LSAKLLSLFIEDKVKIKIGKAELNILLYAEDIILQAYNIFDLKEKINILRQCFHENDLQVNLSTSKVVIFRQSNHTGLA
jgi:hypothetical protein